MLAAAKGLEQLQCVGADEDGAGLAGLTEEANVASLIQRFDVLPPRTAPAWAASKRRLTYVRASALSMPEKTGGTLATVLAKPLFFGVDVGAELSVLKGPSSPHESIGSST